MSEPITAERIEALRCAAQDARELLVTVEDGWGMAEVDAEELDELLDEIERLRGWLRRISSDPIQSRYDLRHWAWCALAGQVPS